MSDGAARRHTDLGAHLKARSALGLIGWHSWNCITITCTYECAVTDCNFRVLRHAPSAWHLHSYLVATEAGNWVSLDWVFGKEEFRSREGLIKSSEPPRYCFSEGIYILLKIDKLYFICLHFLLFSTWKFCLSRKYSVEYKIMTWGSLRYVPSEPLKFSVCKLTCRSRVSKWQGVLVSQWKGQELHSLHRAQPQLLPTHILLFCSYQKQLRTHSNTWQS
jgi:hypothetical protein